MHETAGDLVALRGLLDRSASVAGPHLSSIMRPERRLTAEDLAGRLQGMVLLVAGTVTADGRPLVGPVDGIFFRGAFHFGSSPSSVRMRHLAARPAVSVTHVPGEYLSVTAHGRAVPVDPGAPRHAAFRRTLLDVYVPRYGEAWERFLDTEATYVRVEAERLLTVYVAELDPGPVPAGGG